MDVFHVYECVRLMQKYGSLNEMECESGIRIQNDLQFVFFLVRKKNKNKFSLLYTTGSSQKFIDNEQNNTT